MTDMRSVYAIRNATALGTQYNGRTDGRTNEESHPVASNLTAVDAGARSDESQPEVVTHDELVATLERLWEPPQRFPVSRIGERERIAPLVRWSIGHRDNFTCQVCSWDLSRNYENIELDHIKPWSAGGPDDSDNLRVLCKPDNQKRSNYDDGAEIGRVRPTTYWCAECWHYEFPAGLRFDARRTWRDLTDLTKAPTLSEGQDWRSVYCAFCREFSTSSIYFVGAMGRKLAHDAEHLKRRRGTA